jgi:sugar lactone lactonase YvrE
MIRALAFSPDGKLLAVGGYQSLRLWDPQSRKPVRDFDGHTGQVTSVAFFRDGKRLVSSSHDESVRVWDVATGKELKRIGDFDYPVNGVAVSPDGKWIATASGDEFRVTRSGLVKLWNADTGKEKTWTGKDSDGNPQIVRLVEHEKAANSVAFSPDGTTLISTSFDEKINVYDLQTGKPFGFFNGHYRPTNDAVFLSDGEIVVSAGGGRAKKRNMVMVWNLKSGDEFIEMEGHRAPVTSVAVTPDEKVIVSAGKDNTVVFWDYRPIYKKVVKFRSEEPVEAVKPKQRVPNPRPQARVGRIANPSVSDSAVAFVGDAPAKKTLRVGIIGLDTSHAIAFTRALNDKNAKADIANCRVVAAYPKGSPDIESSTKRVPGYTKTVKELGVEIVDSIPELLKRVDCVLLETNDGRPHLEQVLPVLKAGKPVFIDKPIAGTLADAVAIFEAAKKYKTPVFSASSLRYMGGAQKIRNGEIGKVQEAEAWSPAHLEKTHPDLFWYGIHGVEALFTMMGAGCETVTRTKSTRDMDEVVGTWTGGRKGTFQGFRKGGKRGYGGSAKGTTGEMPAGDSPGYRPLIVDIVKFFRTRKLPVTERETLEIYAFMEAADESKRRGGKPVKLETVLAKARADAKKRLAKLDR